MARNLTLPEYAAARISRILPVAIAGILLGHLAWWAAQLWNVDLHQPSGFDRAGMGSFLFAVTFMSMSPIGWGPVANPPFWSLCYEVWYYIFFALAFYLNGPRRAIYIAVAGALAGPRILLLMPVWLAGIWVRGQLLKQPVSRLDGVVCIVGGGVAAFYIAQRGLFLRNEAAWITGLNHQTLMFSQDWLSDWLMTPAIAAIFLGMVPWVGSRAPWLERLAPAIRLGARSSFTLYLVHWPIISLLTATGMGVSRLPAFAAIITLVAAAAALLAQLLENTCTMLLRKTFANARLARGRMVRHSFAMEEAQ